MRLSGPSSATPHHRGIAHRFSETSGNGRSIAQNNRSSGQTLQRVIDKALIKRRPKYTPTPKLQTLANTYNFNQETDLATRIGMLHNLQAALLQWLDNYKETEHFRSETGDWVRDMLNEVEREHQTLIAESLDQNDENSEPPVAGFSSLSPEWQDWLRGAWTRLVNGTGNIRISGIEHLENNKTKEKTTREQPGFRLQVLSRFARLLETGAGRVVVNRIDIDPNEQKLILIEPTTVEKTATKSSGDDATLPTDKMGNVTISGDNQVKLVNFDEQFKKDDPDRERKIISYKKKFLKLTGKDPLENVEIIYNMRWDHRKRIGFVIDENYFLIGCGTGSLIKLLCDVPDSSRNPGSRMVDQEKNELPMPHYMTLGHELGHSQHSLEGVSLNDQVVSLLLEQLYWPGTQMFDNWSDPEEVGNINLVENSMRNELEMTPRFGHGNWASYQRNRVKGLLGGLEFFVKLMEDSAFNQLNPMVEALRELYSIGNIEAMYALIRDIFDQLLTHLNEAFQGFPDDDMDVMREALLQAYALTPEGLDNVVQIETYLVAALDRAEPGRKKIPRQVYQPESKKKKSFFSNWYS